MLRVSVFNAHRRSRVRKAPIVACVKGVLRGEQRRRADVSVIFIDSRSCRRMHRIFLHHDSATDVMSFSMEDGVRLEGEVYVNVDRARTQARRYGVSTANEVVRLAVHGTLHLAGYDDRRARDREKMRAREDFYTERFAGHVRQ